MGVFYIVWFFCYYIIFFKVFISVGDEKIYIGECDLVKDNGECK